MCEPTTILAATSAVSTLYSANAAYQQGQYQQSVAEYNAQVTENEAQSVRNAGVLEENEQRRETAELLSRQRAQLGAANIDMSSGSALKIQEDADTLGETDALRIRSNYDDQYTALEDEATLLRQQGDDAASAGTTAAFGTLLSGTTSFLGTGVADKWFTSSSSALV